MYRPVTSWRREIDSIMRGETNLSKLLASMSPELAHGEYVFCSIGNARYGDHADLEPIAAITETAREWLK